MVFESTQSISHNCVSVIYGLCPYCGLNVDACDPIVCHLTSSAANFHSIWDIKSKKHKNGLYSNQVFMSQQFEFSFKCLMNENFYHVSQYVSYRASINFNAVLTWWRHQMETFSALLTICAGNSPVPGEVPSQRPVTRTFDVYFELRLNKRLSKQSWGWWFETLSSPLWRHSNG